MSNESPDKSTTTVFEHLRDERLLMRCLLDRSTRFSWSRNTEKVSEAHLLSEGLTLDSHLFHLLLFSPIQLRFYLSY